MAVATGWLAYPGIWLSLLRAGLCFLLSDCAFSRNFTANTNLCAERFRVAAGNSFNLLAFKERKKGRLRERGKAVLSYFTVVLKVQIQATKAKVECLRQ